MLEKGDIGLTGELDIASAQMPLVLRIRPIESSEIHSDDIQKGGELVLCSTAIDVAYMYDKIGILDVVRQLGFILLKVGHF